MHRPRKRWAKETVIGGIDPKAWYPCRLTKLPGTGRQHIGPTIVVGQVIHPPPAPAGHVHNRRHLWWIARRERE